MKIAYVTSMYPSNENRRIRQEVELLGHKFAQYIIGVGETIIKDGKIINNKLLNTDCDLIILRGILASMKTVSAISRHLRSKGKKVFDNSFCDHEYSISKITDMVKLSLNNIPVPDTYHLREFDKYFAVAKKLKYPVIVKSNRSGKGRGVYKADNEDALRVMLSGFVEEEKKPKYFIIQEYIPYVMDIRALIIGKRMFSMRRIPSEGEFRANFSLGGSVETIELDEKTKKLAFEALSAVDMTVGGVDILITPDNKKYILEVNHNPGFTGMEKTTGLNIAKLYVEHAIQQAK